MASRSACGALPALLLCVAVLPIAAGAKNGVERVLVLSGPLDGAVRLERDLNERSAGRLFVVFRHPTLESGVSAALEHYAPSVVVAPLSEKDGAWSSPLGEVAASLRARGAALILAHGPGKEAARFQGALPPGADVVLVENGATIEGVVPAIQTRLGVPRAAAAVTRDERERLARRAGEIRREYGAGAEEKRLLALLEKSPDDLEVLAGLAAIHRDHIQYWHALSYLDRLAASARASSVQRAGFLRQAGETRLQIGDYAAAAADFQRGLEAAPGDPGLLLLLAEAKRERPEEALPFAEKAAGAPAASAHQRAQANRLAGELRADLSDAAGAAKSLELALKDAPGDLETLHALVRVKRTSKAAALPYAERASREAGKAPAWLRGAALRLAARAWLELDEHDRAAAELGRALTLDPEDLDALRLLAGVKGKLSPQRLAGLRRAAPAAAETAAPASPEAARLALKGNPADLEALRVLALAARDAKRPGEADGYAQRFMDAVWRAPAWHREDAARALVRLWLALGNDERAALVMDAVRNLQSDSIASFRLASEMSHPEATVRDPAWAIGSICAAAVLRLELGDRAGAEEQLKMALKLDPTDSWTLELMSSLDKPR